jgi:hypothetical protein
MQVAYRKGHESEAGASGGGGMCERQHAWARTADGQGSEYLRCCGTGSRGSQAAGNNCYRLRFDPAKHTHKIRLTVHKGAG